MEMICGEKLNIGFDTAVTIGNFDGLHLGHMRLLSALTKRAKEQNLKSLVYTFSEHPVQILKGNLPVITTKEEKIRRMEQAGVDILYFADFISVKDLSPESFVEDVLLQKLHMKTAVIGENNRFGKHSAGDPTLLCEIGKQRNFSVQVIPSLTVNGVVCSSTAIREAVQNGKVEFAEKLLGRPYIITGNVIEGKHLGRTYGFPTVNMKPIPGQLLPKSGVYATETVVNGNIYPAITNVGETSFDEKKCFRIETHILDFTGNLYGQTIPIRFLRYMRDVLPFSTTEELKCRLQQDREIRYHIMEEA